MTMQRPILWIHEEALGPANPALRAWPEAPALFVFDTRWIQTNGISRKRLGFLYESALELPLTLRKGCLLYTSPSPRDLSTSRMPSSA